MSGICLGIAIVQFKPLLYCVNILTKKKRSFKGMDDCSEVFVKNETKIYS